MAKVNHPPAFLFYPDDFSSDGKVEAMTTEEVGAYILLLCKSWREKPPGSLPSDDPTLARWARLTLDRWLVCRQGVLAAYTFGTDSRWHQKRLRREYDKLLSFRKDKQKAAVSMWEKKKLHARALHEQCFPFPSPSSNAFNPKSQQDAAAVAITPVEIAAAFKTFSELGISEPFGDRKFQLLWVRKHKNRTGEWWTDAMEETIVEGRAQGIGIPPVFYELKHEVERAEKAESERRRSAAK